MVGRRASRMLRVFAICFVADGALWVSTGAKNTNNDLIAFRKPDGKVTIGQEPPISTSDGWLLEAGCCISTRTRQVTALAALPHLDI